MALQMKGILLRELRAAIERIEKDECAMSESEAMRMISVLTHVAMSKEDVLVYLGWSRSKFDDYCVRGLMPKGKKRTGWKELVWYKDEINDAIILLREKYNY